MKKYVLALLAAGAFTACQNPKSAELETLQKEVEGMHDKIMAPYMQIEDLREEILQQVAKDSTRKASGDSLITALTLAEKGMDDWMSNYNGDTLLAISPEEGHKYLLQEKDKVNHVEALTNESVAAAKRFLKK